MAEMLKPDEARKLLQEFVQNDPETEGAAFVTLDGLAVASVFKEEVDDDELAAMSAALIGIAERVANDLGRGTPDQIILKGTKGYALVRRIGDLGALVVMTTPKARLGMVFYNMKAVVKTFES